MKMSTTTRGCVFALTLALMVSCSWCGRLGSRRETKKILRGVDPLTQRNIRAHRCHVTELQRRNDRVTGPYVDRELHCAGLESGLLPVRVCDRKCVDPLSCRKIGGVVNKAVHLGSRVRTSEGDEVTFFLPTACECKRKTKKSKKKKKKKKHKKIV